MVMTDAGAGVREGNKKRIRQGITDAAFQLFVDRGIDDTTVDDIAAVAGVSRRTFYRYFSSAEDVLNAFDQAIGDSLCSALLARPASEPPLLAARHALYEVLGSYEIEQSRSMALMRLMTDSSSSPAWRRATYFWADGLKKALHQRLDSAASALIADLAAALVVSVATEAIARWVSQGAEGEFQGLLSEAFDMADALNTESLMARAADSLRRKNTTGRS